MKRMDQKEWAGIIAQWGSSNLSQTEFCKAKKISIWSLRRWQKKLNANAAGRDTSFVQIHAPIDIKNTKRTGSCRIIRAGGYSIEIEADTSVEAAITALRALEGLCGPK